MMTVYSKRDLSGLGLDVPDYNTDSGYGIDTSGISVSTPTGAQTTSMLNAIAQSSCADSGGIWDRTNNSCAGSGGSATCPTGYVLTASGVCQKPGSNVTTPAIVAGASTPNYLLYAALGIGLLALIKAGK